MNKSTVHQREVQLRQLAKEVERDLAFIRQELRRPVNEEFAKGGLTGPQRNVMHALFHSDGQSLKQLTAQVGLAHSTVSGIVDRLEERGLVERRTDPADRRHTRIAVSQVVCDFMQRKYPTIAADPLLKAFRRATAEQRESIVSGIRTLRLLFEDAQPK